MFSLDDRKDGFFFFVWELLNESEKSELIILSKVKTL